MTYRFTQLKIIAGSLAISLAGAGCTSLLNDSPSAETQSVEAQANVDEAQKQASAAPVPPGVPDFSTALERHSPLGTINGDHRPLAVEVLSAEERFSDAISYAAAMDSYALLIWKNGQLQVEKYFEPHTKDIRSESASMHKSVVGLLIASAIADGLIESADDSIGKYLARWENDPRGDIPLRNLLTMSSGLEPLIYDGSGQSEAAKFNAGIGDVRDIIFTRPLSDNISTETFYYSGLVTQLLVLILEEASGKPYADYLSERLWAPLGAEDASVWLYEEDGFPRGHTALLARPRDWLRLGLLIKDQGKFEGEQLIPEALMEAATTPSAANANYGWQIWLGNEYQDMRFYNDAKIGPSVLASEPYAVDDIVFFDGFGGQRVYTSRSENLVIVRLGALRFDWDDARLPNLVIGAPE